MKKLIFPACVAGVAITMIAHPYKGSNVLMGSALLLAAALSVLPDHSANSS